MKTLFYVSCTEIGSCAIRIITDPEARKPIIATLYNSKHPNGTPYNDVDAIALLTWHDLDMDNVNEETFNKFVDDMQSVWLGKDDFDTIDRREIWKKSKRRQKL